MEVNYMPDKPKMAAAAKKGPFRQKIDGTGSDVAEKTKKEAGSKKPAPGLQCGC